METLCRLAHGSLRGSDHGRALSNRQDACAVGREGDVAFGFVADGCGEGRASEVGAALSVALARSAAGRALRDGAPVDALPGLVADAVLAGLGAIAGQIAARERAAFVRDHLCATLLGVAVRAGRGVVFGAGDGLLLIDDEVVAIDEDNRPHYLAYGLARGSARLSCVRPFAGARRAGVASDGLRPEGLRALAACPGQNLTRHLVLQQRAGGLRDDGAVVIAHCDPGAARGHAGEGGLPCAS